MRVEARVTAAANQSNGRQASSVEQVREIEPRARTVSLFVVAGVRLYRDALAERLAQDPGLEVVGAAADAHGAAAQVSAVRPDVVLVDCATVECPPTTRAILDAAPAVKVVAFGVPDSEPEVIAFAEAGVAGYVGREEPFEDMVAAVESASRGEAFSSPWMVAALLGRVATLAAGRRDDHAAARLTARERDIAQLIELGLTNREIAKRLCIQVATVKNHVHNILEKLEVHCRSDIAARIHQASPV